jgi:F-type H+-transporting ATPase subunit a
MTKIIIGVIVTLVVIVLGNILLPVPMAAISVAAEPIGLGPVLTNAVLTSIILSLIIIVGAFIVGRTLKEVPSGLQNVAELVIETLNNFVHDIAPHKWTASFFPIVATIFIFLIFSNYFGLLAPFLGSFGIIHSTTDGGIPVEDIIFIQGSPETMTPMHHPGEDATHSEEGEQAADEEHAEQPQNAIIVPFFRAPSSDLNLTMALALTAVFLTQYFGVRALGVGYFGKFFQFKSIGQKGLMMGLIDVFVGILELISEIAKILWFAFRLFGNIFAGEVLLIIMSSLVTLGVVIIFFGLELFVGLIQAFVFFILSLVFFSIATHHHGGEEHHSEH